MRARRHAPLAAAPLLALWLTAPAGAADEPSPAAGAADVLAVEARGRPGAYVLRVTLRSPDLDCRRYANWWEVLRPDGTLVYRRILAHSHATEQPFTRAGGPVAVAPDQELLVRGHMHPGGYGGAVFRGNVKDGFARWADAPRDLAADLAEAPPQPDGCRY